MVDFGYSPPRADRSRMTTEIEKAPSRAVLLERLNRGQGTLLCKTFQVTLQGFSCRGIEAHDVRLRF